MFHYLVFITCLGPIVKLPKATIRSPCLSLCPPVRPTVRPSVCIEQLASHRTNFHEIWYLSILRKTVENIKVSLKSEKNKGYFTWRPAHCLIIYSSILLTTRNVSDKSSRGNQNTRFSFFFRKIVPFWRWCGKIF